MAEVDWTLLEGGLDINTLDRGATNGIARPPGGGNFVYGFASLTAADGACGLFVNGASFAPMTKGGSIRGCMQRGAGGGPTGFSPFFFLCAQGDSVLDSAYLLGLSDDDPHRIVVRKGAVAVGLGPADGPGILRKSSESFGIGTWLHLRLDVVVNTNSDVIVQVFRNSLTTNPIGTSPNWQPIPGLSQVIDDQQGVNTGSQPLTSGYGGFGVAVTEVTRRAYFDHIEIFRQV